MTETQILYRRAAFLAAITVFYNIAEGIVSVWLGGADDTVSLFGFGLDSFVEVISGIGVWHMVRRISREAGSGSTDRFERTALRVTGGAFYLLAGGLVLTAAIDLFQGHRPETTLWGVVVAIVSILSMALLIRAKEKTGRALGSAAILADASCTRTCLYLSFLLLASSLGYLWTGIGSLDSLGALGIAGFALKEGREAFGKAAGKACSCSCSCGA